MSTPYVLIGDITASLAPDFLTQALDDNGDGVADPGVWDSIAAAVAKDIDGRLGQRYETPFSNPIPAIVANAGRIFAMEMLYARRGFAADKNPWTKQADAERTRLTQIAEGKAPLMPEIARKKPSASTITEPAKTTSATGKLAA